LCQLELDEEDFSWTSMNGYRYRRATCKMCCNFKRSTYGFKVRDQIRAKETGRMREYRKTHKPSQKRRKLERTMEALGIQGGPRINLED
jgi:hypothetical protein